MLLPNPAKTNFKLLFPDIEGNNISSLVIYNQTGQLIQQMDLESGAKEKEVNCTDYMSGLYYILIKDNKGVVKNIEVLVKE